MKRRMLQEQKEASFHKQHKSMSRPPAAKIFTALDLAGQIPEYSRITLLISALSAEKHRHFLSQLDVFIGVNYKEGWGGCAREDGSWELCICIQEKQIPFPLFNITTAYFRTPD